jgi:hydrogenase expression/formation protein HypC
MCLGIPGRIVALTDTERKLALVDVCGVQRQINLACIVDDAHPLASCVGEWVLVHVGFAMSRIDEQEAKATLALLEQLGEAQETVEMMRRDAVTGG